MYGEKPLSQLSKSQCYWNSDSLWISDLGKKGNRLFTLTGWFLVITQQRQLSIGISFPGVLSGNDLAKKEKLTGCCAHMAWLMYATKMCHLWHKPKCLRLHLHQRNPEYLVHNLGDDCSGNIWLFCKALQEQNRRKLAVNLVVVKCNWLQMHFVIQKLDVYLEATNGCTAEFWIGLPGPFRITKPRGDRYAKL